MLTLSIEARVSPEPETIELLRRHRLALSYAINKILCQNLKSTKDIYRGLYRELIEWFRLPSRVVIECYGGAIAYSKA